MHRFSRFAYWASAVLIIASSLFYYPKWKAGGTEATISWDVSGYYLYLPAALIYKDVKQLKWWAEVDAKYHPGPGMGQAFKHPSGNYVMKYSMGQAIQFLPWFLTAHVLAEPLGYPADGFSRPYQVAISWGSLLVMLFGLWMLRKVLLRYFSDRVTAAVLISIAFGSNYLEYAGITGAMTHNWLFTLYASLIYCTIRFYEKPGYGWAILVGLLVGWATLTRPTEIISALIPLLWGVHSRATVASRIKFFRNHISQILLAACV
ncbi:MAG: glycosyltransferase family 39 protein, partial [Saprospiraceae bacterium]|nr:glycosyltransferase family 39 protein [Saprospiraceae bacterium]